MLQFHSLFQKAFSKTGEITQICTLRNESGTELFYYSHGSISYLLAVTMSLSSVKCHD